MGLGVGGCAEKSCSLGGLVIGTEGNLGSNFAEGKGGHS